jgi:hypothetical protein
MFGPRSPTDLFTLLAGSPSSGTPPQAGFSVEALSTDLLAAGAILVVAVVVAAAYAKQRANILTVGLILSYIFVVRANASIAEIAEVWSAWAIHLSPLGTVAGAILAAGVVAGLSSFADRTRTVMFGGAVAFLLALLAGDALLVVLIERGMIGDATLRPYGWSRRAGLQLGIAVGILVIVGPVIMRASSRIRQRRASTAETGEDNDGGEADPVDGEEDSDAPSEAEDGEGQEPGAPPTDNEGESRPDGRSQDGSPGRSGAYSNVD